MKAACATVLAAFIAVSAFANPAFPKKAILGLSEQELAILDGGKALVRQVSSPSSLSLGASGAFADEIRNRVKTLAANYIGEVIMVIPAGSSPSDFMSTLAGDLANVEGYVGIPYWSKQNKRLYDLFDKMRIVERTRQAGGQTVVADQHMEPFADYRARYSYELDAGELHFRSENLTTISYKGFDAVGPGNMVWYLYGFSQDGATILYGVGAVKAFDMYGLLGDRLRTSFMGRIQAFLSYMYDRKHEKVPAQARS